ncbi:hypothetical protein WA026_018364 [Henosepilachna vigintioctopunctata]|uniref:UDP-glucuronosyltransferase n=1 Tax=Henosepilachna vigintioctopunctata TaxID=420089 RepID=A0AAW1VGH2_9CUCU
MFEDIQTILDGAKEGVVYFSLGTNVRFDHVQGNFKEAVLKALGQLPYTVLCKWESDDHPEKPKNVILRKWFPQQSIMAHPNLKVFVTQGGLQSAEEAIINGVPLVIIPFLGDQPKNAKIFTKQGMAETISPRAVNEQNLKETILKVAGNERYRIRAKEIRSIFLDQPRSGLDTIMWWCDYVMRHKGAKHLKSPGAEISFYEYYLLDVLALFLVAFFVLFKAVKLLWATLIGLLRGSKQRKVSKKKNK